jgi:ech hydrogenase subunit D
MRGTQTTRDLPGIPELLQAVEEKKQTGWRLSQMHAVDSDRLYLYYTFVRDNDMESLRISPERGTDVESISGIFPYAFLYENEIKELFGVNIVNISLDFGGTFYKIAKETPFAKPVSEEAPEADAAPAAEAAAPTPAPVETTEKEG